ncbi:MAG: hypothetical protein ACOX4N_00115 [Dethiobacteraceae bacterium]
MVAAVLSAALAGCGGGNTPEKVTEQFFKAILNGNDKQAINLCARENEAPILVGMGKAAIALDAETDYNFTITEETEGTATVNVETKSGRHIAKVKLINQDEKWKITYVG